MSNKLNLKNISTLLILGCITGLSGCSFQGKDNIAKAENKPEIVASHSILCDLVNTLAEDTVNLTCLIDGDRDPHNYNPTPSQLKAIEKAQLILYGGYQLEPKIIKLIAATENPSPKIAVYEEVVAEPIQSQHEHEADSKEEHTELEPDPHVWQDVENIVAAIELIQPILLQLNSSEAARYLQNSSILVEKLWQLDGWIDEQIVTIPEGKRILVTTHDSFNYFVEAYPLEDYKTLQGLSSQTAPTASQVKDLAMEIKQIGIPTIFVEATKSDRIMNNVARAANVELATDKLFADGLGIANSYSAMMSHNVCAIVNGLGGECQPFEE
ncbi:zinc ABC transporter substrate-binding protein [Waterburya agarophytonicola K14]|uniref:Zinc ABC transporter substrate-binding protein n=1 Tax=Waterburya agarophytonicola KI4 TaxID=2874699 RepID=A0A964FFS0_9CYAN|nr:zinc ABC transporter substrate-binding protein [Waterburya agarophytonicola]MCC0175738.1 zinc ABC transporter substrate-binding protein [Waterburya agarophytonicola KI4]